MKWGNGIVLRQIDVKISEIFTYKLNNVQKTLNNSFESKQRYAIHHQMKIGKCDCSKIKAMLKTKLNCMVKLN